MSLPTTLAPGTENAGNSRFLDTRRTVCGQGIHETSHEWAAS